MSELKPFQILLDFDVDFADADLKEQELRLVSMYLPELLKEMISHTSTDKD